MNDQHEVSPQVEAEHNREAQHVDREEPPRIAFPVVGIGASAGGLEAFFEFFDAVPEKSGMAYVLIQHLPPDRGTMLVSLLSTHTTMPVLEIEDGMPIEVDHVYVIRPGHTVTVREGLLHLGQPLVERRNNRPVDDFFRSLAEEQRERAICIVMSGMGSNGTEGSRMISAVGGLCVAQEPESAKFPSMPHHLIEQGNADFVLRPTDMPEALLRYASQPYAQGESDAPATAGPDTRKVDDILNVLRARTKRDFTGYKRPTVVRRIRRRMSVLQLPSLDAYGQILRKNTVEAQALADDLLIHVTGFFRDPEAWESLRTHVIEPLVASREDNATIRCWVTACATGEEAYSLAILLDEAALAAGKRFDIKVFATDMAHRALGHARAGIYANGIETDITPERLHRYFQKDDGIYRVNGALRAMVVFAPQNVLQDPPFSRLDICSCRNMLIYLEPPAQARLLNLLHFGLQPGGVLFLGSSETAGAEDMFEPIDRRWRIYRRGPGGRHTAVDFAHVARVHEQRLDVLPAAASARLTTQWLIDGHLPASVTVDRSGRVLFFHGDTEVYLQQPRGEPTRELMTLVREGLRIATRSALEGAIASGETVSLPSRLVAATDSRVRAWVTASALEARDGSEAHYLVSFEQRTDALEPSDTADSSDLPKLHHELDRMRQELQRTVTELQIRNEELRASNEEVTSINEELQSTNEELETSKEELQSLNEELTTVNGQLQAKVLEHEAITNDLSSLLLSTDIAVVFLDREFKIRRYTPAVGELFDLIPTDAGRPLANLARKFVDDDLMMDASTVLERLVPLEREVTNEKGRWFLRRLLPYRTASDHIDGVVITFIDITTSKRAELRLAEKARLLDLSGDAIVVCDLQHRIAFWNLGATRQFGFEANEAMGRPLLELLQNEAFQPPADLEGRRGTEPVVSEVVHVSRGGRAQIALCRWALERDAAGKPLSYLLSSTDVTEQRSDSEALRFGQEQLRMLVDGARDYAMVLLDPDGIITAWNVGAERVLGYREAEAVGQSIGLIFTPEDRAAGAHHRERADSARDGRAEDARWHLRKDGQRFFSNGVMNTLRAPDGTVRGFVKILRDDTARKLAEEALKRSAEQSASANRMKDTFLATLSHELRTPLAAIQLWAHVLKKQKPEDLAGKARAVEAIAQSALAQNQLIDDLLDTVRISSGAVRLEVQACEITPLLHSWIESIRLMAEAKSVSVALEVEPNIGMIATDPDRLQQVVWNLLKNAVTFTPSGGQVTVSVKRRTSELQVRVSDTGAGIAPEFLPHVFEAFRQGDGSNTRSTGGLGLGLSIVWKLVHLLGGTIRAESDGLGLGATFVVRLPTAPTPHGRRRESTEEFAAVRSNRLRGMKILIVEDTAETREAMAMILRSAESEVTSVGNAAEAFAAYLTSPPHLIVSDIAMPGEDGFSLMRRIRAHERTRGVTSIPSIAVTALAHADDRAMVLESGFDAHLVKPFEAEGLILALVDLLGQDSVVSRRGKSE